MLRYQHIRFFTLTLVIFCCIIKQTFADGLLLDRTRVIFPLDQTKISVELFNSNSYPVLSQFWIDEGDINQDIVLYKSPIIIAPPIVKLAAQERRFITLNIANKKHFSEENESILWLNIQEIPPIDIKSEAQINTVSLSLVNRLKVFIRPNKLVTSHLDPWIKSLSCHTKILSQVTQITCSNPSPYFATISSLSVKTDNKIVSIEGEMLKPNSEHTFTTTISSNQKISGIDLIVIGDNGFPQTKTIVF